MEIDSSKYFLKIGRRNNAFNNDILDYGYYLLNSCDPDAILFTYGDIDTNPLWYFQEIHSIREDIKVVNLSLLNTPKFIEYLQYRYPDMNLNFDNKNLQENIL